METVENQKIIIVSKEPADKTHPYSIINLEAMDNALTSLNGNEFKVWSYLAKNQNQYTFALSRVTVCRICNFSESTYHRAIAGLKTKGYLVPASEKKNTYIFYELPNSITDPWTPEDLSISIPETKIQTLKNFKF